MATKTIKKTAERRVSGTRAGGIDLYFKRIFALMFGAVALTGVAAFFTLISPSILGLLFSAHGFSGFYYVLLFGGLA